MEIVTVGQILQDNTIIYEVEKDGAHVFYGESRSISEFLNSGASSVTAAVKHGRSLYGYDITPIGRFEYHFEKDGVIGSKRMIRKTFNLSPNTKFYKTIGGFVNNQPTTEITVETFKKRQEVEQKSHALELQKLVSQTSPNKRYVDSLYHSCFKGW